MTNKKTLTDDKTVKKIVIEPLLIRRMMLKLN